MTPLRALTVLIMIALVAVAMAFSSRRQAAETEVDDRKRGPSVIYQIVAKHARYKQDADFDAYRQFVLDVYPASDWHFDAEHSASQEMTLVFFATDPGETITFLQQTAPHAGMLIRDVHVQAVHPTDWEQICRRLQIGQPTDHDAAAPQSDA